MMFPVSGSQQNAEDRAKNGVQEREEMTEVSGYGKIKLFLQTGLGTCITERSKNMILPMGKVSG